MTLKFTVDHAAVKAAFPSLYVTTARHKTHARIDELWGMVCCAPRGERIDTSDLTREAVEILLYLAIELSHRHRDYALRFAARTKRRNYPKSYHHKKEV